MRNLLAALLVLALTTFTHAQPMADHIPADAVFYAGWAGSEKLGESYNQSHLKAVLATSDLPKLFTEFFPKLVDKIGQNDPHRGRVATFLGSVGAQFWRHPTAVYFGGFDFSNPREPQPRIELVCDAGADAVDLVKQLQLGIDASGKKDVALKVEIEGTIVTFRVGPERAGVAGQPNLAADGRFKEAMAQLQPSPVAAAYVDLERLVALINQSPVRGKSQADAHNNWIKVRDALALDKLQTFAWAGAFDGKQWSTRAFLAAPAPRTGIMAVLDSATVSDEILKLVPDTATMFGACTFDPAKLLAGIRTTAGKVDPATPGKIDAGLDRFRTMTGLDLQKDLLDTLGEQWAYFSDPNLSGGYAYGATLVNKLKDPAKADASFTQLERAISNILGAAMGDSQMHVTFRQTTTPGGLTIHFLATPIVRPAWAIKDGVLYAGLFPQVVAASALRPAGKSILDNAAYAGLRKHLCEQKATSIQYADLPRTAPLMYPTWMLISGYVGFGDLFGVPSPAMMIPPLSDLLPQLAPAGSVSWVNETGWHSQGITPFPGARIIGSDPTMTVATPAVLASVLLPSLNRARETANRVKCASNQREIGQAILLYGNEHRGKYPPDLGTLLKTQPIEIDAFVCPSSGDAVPADIRGGTKDAQAAWVNSSSSFVYLGQTFTFNIPADTVVLYEKSDDHDQDGMNLLFADGHVEWEPMDVALKLIKSPDAPAKGPTTR